MKIELNLTELDYHFLLELVHKKYQKLDKNQTNLLVRRDFSENDSVVENTEKKLQELEPSLLSFENIWE